MIKLNKAILPAAFQVNGVKCGIKKSKKLDLALFYSKVPAIASAKFTSNAILAAPLQVNLSQLKSSKYFQAVLVNSGNANCFTGKAGLLDAWLSVSLAAKELKINKKSVLVNSTGIIGKRLPIKKIARAIPGLCAGLSKNKTALAQQAIMTTDTFAKEVSVKFKVGKRMVTVCAVAKGAGMIAPNMATLLCFIFTDALITQPALDKALTAAVENSFNCITVDGCMSTNDTVIVLANGAAGNKLIDFKNNYAAFSQALNLVCLDLAKKVVQDAEGASKFIKIDVCTAKSKQEAKLVALAIANSDLFKTACFGENPNFGRIAAAVGASGIKVKEEKLKIDLGPLNKKEVNLKVCLGRGKESSTVYTCDLTGEYIKINAEYN
ncbi:MAG: bifunctional glutamate N-acetyltransferase/amino-acid acetyltransferase ArgJ [Candidatus Omnitrophica bacterium]|jgi:glutamate N-acetyltransferase/amino-acid N-acetyltransferase|nr:bifunctional glutamate N-acetyltransferase/amino-acid acetyltransferase ArgJ [Candidatus Omnitrophota bacterium]